MNADYNGVKYFSSTDWSLGAYYLKAISILEEIDVNKEYTDINQILELYNINQIVTSAGINKEG